MQPRAQLRVFSTSACVCVVAAKCMGQQLGVTSTAVAIVHAVLWLGQALALALAPLHLP